MTFFFPFVKSIRCTANAALARVRTRSIRERLAFHFGKPKHYISLSFSSGFRILT